MHADQDGQLDLLRISMAAAGGNVIDGAML
jgi:hypothetical protein